MTLPQFSHQNTLAILDACPEPIYIVNPSGLILEANRAAIEELDIISGEIIDRYYWDHASPIVLEKRKSAFMEAVESRRMIKIIERRRGQCYENVINPVFDEDGQVRMVVICSKDI
ncbi:MAG: PAS domain-containing protein, partial [Deltaproteobacteria bacterium]|nr:PAS domain-containing protein [Deltaproteobacteria bacterium]